MKRRIFLTSLVLWFLLAGPSPAYANNPPAPDGMLSVFLLFPVVILGFRWAGATLTDKERKWRVARIIALVIATVATMAGTGIGGIGLLVLLSYGLLRGGQAISRGQGQKRVAAGVAILVFTLFAASDYFVSLNNWPSFAATRGRAAEGLRVLVAAETSFRDGLTRDANKNGVGEYGNLEQLVKAGLIDSSRFLASEPRDGYHYVVVLSGDPTQDEKAFFVYATPVHYSKDPYVWGSWYWIPGNSWAAAFQPGRRPARDTFAADETGDVRWSDLGGSRAVTRQETTEKGWVSLRY